MPRQKDFTEHYDERAKACEGGFGGQGFVWVAVKELKLSYYIGYI